MVFTKFVQLASLVLMSVSDLGWTNKCIDRQTDGWTYGIERESTEKQNIPFKFQTHYTAFSVPYRATYNALEAHLICLDQDVINKEHTLMTDLRCLKLRSALKRCYQADPATQTERNIQLTRVAEEVSQS